MTIVIPPDLIRALRTARHIVVLTGAGISAESGVPTFREAQTGLWAQYDPEELATPWAFQHNPRLVWEWYSWRRELVAQAQPNQGHLALVELERKVPNFTLITQNVDGLHSRAGSQKIIELHGNLAQTKCFANNHIVSDWPTTSQVPPSCPQCGSLLRPAVVWFGESLPYAALQQAIEASRTCDLFFTIGTSALVHPAASLPLAALQHKAITVEINLEVTPLTSSLSFALQGAAGTILPAIVSQITL